MEENKFEKYLSLKTAAGLYGYTRDHLGLMIRQGKLKGIKLGSYYVTTRDWMMDYLKNHADLGHPTAAGKFSNKFLIQAFAANEAIQADTKDKFRAKSKITQKNIRSKSADDFFSEIQKELLPSLKELSAVREKSDILSASPDLHHTISGNPYVILPIRKMEESECEEILRKISDRNESGSEPEAV